MSTGVWFRNALRLHDNAPLLEAAKSTSPIVCFYIFSPNVYNPKYMGLNRLHFLLQSLRDLKTQLRQTYQADLILLNSKTSCKDVLSALSRKKLLGSVYYEYDSTPYGKRRDAEIEADVKGIAFEALSGHTLTHLPRVVARNGFKNPKSMAMVQDLVTTDLGVAKGKPSGINVPAPLGKPKTIDFDGDFLERMSGMEGFEVLEEVPDLSDLSRVFGPTFAGIDVQRIEKNTYFPGGETEALDRLRRRIHEAPDFVTKFKKPETASISSSKSSSYREPSTSGLSPYLALGCLSVRTFWHEIEAAFEKKNGSKPKEYAQSLFGQLLFREMFYILSESIGDSFAENTPKNPVVNKFVEWDPRDEKLIAAWENGRTGYPYIDALMRQLKATGWMHHLGRHAVSCFFTRGQLYQNWTFGRDVFDRDLIDSDYALNTGNWLWLSGIAVYSPPFFRVYSPSPNEKKKSALNFIHGGNDFIRHWVPELKSCPSDHLTEPWNLPAKLRAKLDYPDPIVPPKGGEALKKFKRSLDERKAAASGQEPPKKKLKT